jgi:hypothetical protein
MYVLHQPVFLSFLRIIRGLDYPGKYISQPTRIIGSLLYFHLKDSFHVWV